MASKAKIKTYKGSILTPIHKRRVELGFKGTIEQTDSYLKKKAGVNMSTIIMTSDEIEELILWSELEGDQIGLDLRYPNNEYKDLDFNRTNKNK